MNEDAKKYNVLWILLDDISTERFPESGNQALDGMLPGFDELKDDGAVYYPYFYAPSSMCAPVQVVVVLLMIYLSNNLVTHSLWPYFSTPE